MSSPLYGQFDSWPVVLVSETGNMRNFVVDEEENIYTLLRDGMSVDVAQDSFISFRWFNLYKHNSKGQLIKVKDSMNLDNYNNSHLRHKGPTAFEGHYHDNKIYVHGKMRSPETPTAFVYILNATTFEEEATHFIEIPDVEEISGSSGTRLWIHPNGILNLYVTISATDQRIYKIEGNDVQKTYQFGFSNVQNNGSFILNNELYTGRRFYDVTISKRDHLGGVVGTYKFPYYGSYMYKEEGKVNIYYHDFMTFTEDGFQYPHFRQEDFNPPLCTSCYTFIDFASADDGSFLALGFGQLFNNQVTALHRFYEDGTTDYAFLYDSFFFPMDGPKQIEKISKGFIIGGHLSFGEHRGNYLTLIDEKGYLITNTEAWPPQARIPLLLYPNPVMSQLFMELDKDDFHVGILEVYSINGQMVHRQQVTSSKTIVDVGDLTSGTYILRYISDHDQSQVSGKFVKVKD